MKYDRQGIVFIGKERQRQGLCTLLAAIGLTLPAYDYCLKCSHTFNLLDARKAINVAERMGSLDAPEGLGLMNDYKRDIFPAFGRRAAKTRTGRRARPEFAACPDKNRPVLIRSARKSQDLYFGYEDDDKATPEAVSSYMKNFCDASRLGATWPPVLEVT